MNTLDLIIVGAGPAGLACAIEAQKRGLTNVVLEKGVFLAVDEEAAICNLQESAYRLRERVGLGVSMNGKMLIVPPFHK